MKFESMLSLMDSLDPARLTLPLGEAGLISLSLSLCVVAESALSPFTAFFTHVCLLDPSCALKLGEMIEQGSVSFNCPSNMLVL